MLNENERYVQNRDIWSDRWGDPALQSLGRWLTKQGTPDEKAAWTVDGVWLFYSYDLLPVTDRRIPLGIAVKAGGDRERSVHVCVPWPVRTETDSTVHDELRRAFAEDVTEPVGPDPTVRLRFFYRRSPATFEADLRDLCDHEALEYLGIFTDKLEDELKKIMRPDAAEVWLDTPNTLLGGEKPKDILDSPDNDRPIRDLIVSVKHGLVS